MAAQRLRPADKIAERFGQAQRGEEVRRVLGAAVVERQYGSYIPTKLQAEAASRFRGRVQPNVVHALLEGKVMQTTVEMVAQDVALRWRPKTQEDKLRATKRFQDFLAAVGMLERIFPANQVVPTKTEEQSGMEEDCLTGFAMNRAMAGHGLNGIYTIISHVRTWYELKFKVPLGRVGKNSKSSPTSQYIKSMQIYYPVKDDACKKRKPMTRELVELVVREARRWEQMDIGVAVAIAYAGLFRMGELTATEGAFDPVEDMSESDVQFLPSFWKANRVVIQLGRSKADQDGKRSKLRPRVLPVDDGVLMSPGRLLREMIAERQSLRKGSPPLLGAGRPLFQDRNGGQLKQSAVLVKMRKVLTERGGMTVAEALEFGTHSCRIGGATKLFQIGASPEVIKSLGGWSSEAYKLYVMVQQQDLMRFARSMCTADRLL
jgi:hypothetical protein